MNQSKNHNPTFDIVKEAEAIAKKRGFPKGFRVRPKERPSKRVFLNASSLAFQIGLEDSYILSLFSKRRESYENYTIGAKLILNQSIQDLQNQLTKAVDSSTEIERKIAQLQNRVEALDKKLIGHLNISNRDISAKLAIGYVNIVRSIEVVKEILLQTKEDIVTIWTIIDAPPFQDDLRMPIYDAQVIVLRTLENNIHIDFHIVNLSELPNTVGIEQIIPLNAKCIWSRQ